MLRQMATSLQELHRARARQCDALRLSVRRSLQHALREIYLPGTNVWVFGSLVQRGRFNEHSDIDLAVEEPPAGRSLFWLQGELESRVGCAVDVLILAETRLRQKIEREGEMWTL